MMSKPPFLWMRQPVLVIEEPIEELYRVQSKSLMEVTSSTATKVPNVRWDFIKRVYVIHPIKPEDGIQFYGVRRLDVPHYQVSAEEYSYWIWAVNDYAESP